MKLLYAPASPFARKVRVAAIEVGLDDRIELSLTHVAPAKPNRDYGRDYNPLRKIPALALDDGTVLYDSTVICEFLDAQAGGGKLIPSDPPRRWRVLTDYALAQGICEAAVSVRYETYARPEAYRWQAWVDDQWDRVEAALGRFEAQAPGLEAPLDLSHIALGCALGYLDFRWPEHGWRGRFPALRAWYETTSQRPSFKETQPD